MTDNLVKIVNSNGRIGRVSPKYPPLVQGKVRRAPSGLVEEVEIEAAKTAIQAPALPAANASTDVWQAYASSEAGQAFLAGHEDLDPAEVATWNRDDLVALFTSKE